MLKMNRIYNQPYLFQYILSFLHGPIHNHKKRMSHVHSELLHFYENTCQTCYHLKTQPVCLCNMTFKYYDVMASNKHWEITKFRHYYKHWEYGYPLSTWTETCEEFVQLFIEDLDENGMLPYGMLDDYISNEFI